MVFAAPADRLLLQPAAALSLDARRPVRRPRSRTAADNLVLRAARALAAHAGRPPRARIVLEKNLPVAAGLGGGSADAAATLRGLDRLWRLGLGAAALAPLAERLGADVPVCLAARAARMRGIGERLEAAPACRPCRCCWSTRTGRSRPPRCSEPSARCPQRCPSAARRPASWRGLVDWLRAARQSPRGAGAPPAADDRRGARRARGPAGLRARPHVRQRRHLLRPVRRSRRSRTGRGGAPARPAGLVDRRRQPRLPERAAAPIFTPAWASPSGKAPDFESGIRRFESCRPSQCLFSSVAIGESGFEYRYQHNQAAHRAGARLPAPEPRERDASRKMPTSGSASAASGSRSLRSRGCLWSSGAFTFHRLSPRVRGRR